VNAKRELEVSEMREAIGRLGIPSEKLIRQDRDEH